MVVAAVAFLVLALGSGAVLALAFPTVGWAPWVCVAWIPLLVRSRDWSVGRRFLAGWLMGLMTHLILFRWIPHTLDVMTDLPAAAQPVGLLGFSAWHALLAALFLALSEPVRRVAEEKLDGSGPLMVASLYVALEWAFPFVFPWNLGQAFWGVTELSSIMALGGVSALTFLCILVNAYGADWWIGYRGRALRLTALGLTPLLAFGMVWSWSLAGSTGGRELRVAVIQPNHSLKEKQAIAANRRGAGKIKRRMLNRLVNQLRSLEPGSVDLVVAPEGAFPYMWDLPGAAGSDGDPWATRQLLRAVALGPGADTILGGLRRPKNEERLRNTALHVGPTGLVKGIYDKQVLVPMGEYIPGRDLFPELAGSVSGISNFGMGTRPCSFEVAGVQAACGICYETLFDDNTRHDLGDASLLINLSIDTWFGHDVAPPFHLMAQSSRAAELGVPLVRGALSGISAVVGPDGVVQAQLPVATQGILRTTLILPDRDTPYRLVGPWFRWLCVALTTLLLGTLVRRRRKAKLFSTQTSEPPLLSDSQSES